MYFDSSQWPPNGQNVGFYKNAEADAVMETARRELSTEKRVELYRRIQRVLAADPPADFLWNVSQYWGMASRLDGVESLPSASFTSSPGPWRLAARDGRFPVAAVGAPLEGVLVLDLSRVLAGPFCTMMLADLGARVIKVEHPEDGDVTRSWGPPYDPGSGLSAYFLSVNRNKESIALDLAAPAGAESVRTLARRSDVLVENFPPGGFEKFGPLVGGAARGQPEARDRVDHGLRTRGPDAPAPGFDLLAQAGAGLMAITGDAGAERRRSASRFRTCSPAVMPRSGSSPPWRPARAHRPRRHVETDLFSATLASLINVAQSALVTGRRRASRKRAPQIVPYRTFEASDGAFVLGVGTDRQFERLAALVGRPEWAESPA